MEQVPTDDDDRPTQVNHFLLLEGLFIVLHHVSLDFSAFEAPWGIRVLQEAALSPTVASSGNMINVEPRYDHAITGDQNLVHYCVCQPVPGDGC